MSYSKYLRGLMSSISAVGRAERNGVVLTRREKFDNLFKRELVVFEGIRGRKHPVVDSVSYVTNIDYRLANFYAKYFSKIMQMVSSGYSFKGVESLFKDMCSEAKRNYIIKSKVYLSFSDMFNTLTVSLHSSSVEDSMEISDKSDFVSSALFLLSFLGSCDEKGMDAEWFEDYLFDVYSSILRNERARPYLDREVEICRLEEYFISGDKGKNGGNEDGSNTVVEFIKKDA